MPAGIAYDELRDVVAAIDQVHGNGELPRIPVRLVTGIAYRGRFRFDSDSGAPISIVVRADQPYAALAFVHEMGHFLDLEVFGRRVAFGSTDNPAQGEWWGAVTESRAFRVLSSMARREAGEVAENDGTTRLVALDGDELAALARSLRPDELWARSYAQFVATHADHAGLTRNLTALRARPTGKVYYPRQWDDDDFGPIDTAPDALLVRMGWRQ